MEVSFQGYEQNPRSPSFEQWLGLIDGANGEAVRAMMSSPEIRDRLLTAPGSRGAHHAWPGGYQEHIRQTMMIAEINFRLIQQAVRLETLPEEERFSLSDALTVMFLHDIEKPFIYEFDPAGKIKILRKMTKPDRKQFREKIIEDYGFEITPTMANALQFVEGVRDSDYVPGQRADKPLAALCHAADNLSARVFYDYRGLDIGLAESDK